MIPNDSPRQQFLRNARNVWEFALFPPTGFGIPSAAQRGVVPGMIAVRKRAGLETADKETANKETANKPRCGPKAGTETVCGQRFGSEQSS